MKLKPLILVSALFKTVSNYCEHLELVRPKTYGAIQHTLTLILTVCGFLLVMSQLASGESYPIPPMTDYVVYIRRSPLPLP